jgi:hypothetical protein
MPKKQPPKPRIDWSKRPARRFGDTDIELAPKHVPKPRPVIPPPPPPPLPPPPPAPSEPEPAARTTDEDDTREIKPSSPPASEDDEEEAPRNRGILDTADGYPLKRELVEIAEEYEIELPKRATKAEIYHHLEEFEYE